MQEAITNMYLILMRFLLCTVSYSHCILTMVVSYIISVIKHDFGRKLVVRPLVTLLRSTWVIV